MNEPAPLLSIDGQRKAGMMTFSQYDRKELYETNLKTKGPDWYWANRTVTYTRNKAGYRIAEGSWPIDAVLTFGCSYTFGEGVSDDETWPYQLSQIIKKPVLNLGQGGTSAQFIWANTINVISSGYRPSAVVYYWPNHVRVCEFYNPYIVKNYGLWSDIKIDKLWAGWINNTKHSEVMRSKFKESCDLMWKPFNIPVLHYTWDRTVWSEVTHSNIQIDLARDCLHPGPKTHGIFAQTVAQDLQKLSCN